MLSALLMSSVRALASYLLNRFSDGPKKQIVLLGTSREEFSWVVGGGREILLLNPDLMVE